jgi:nicotinamide-nucleotide amidase
MSDYADRLKDTERLVALLRKQNLKVATAESCTGGLVAGAITDIPGASYVFDRGFVVYSNAAKHELLGVARELIATHGAVSAEVARAMAHGALMRSFADIAVAVTGIAGPEGGTAEKPVGLVHFACARRHRGVQHVERRFGAIGRAAVREASVSQALEMLLEAARQ